MKLLPFTLAILFSIAAQTFAADSAPKKSLFDGKSFTGWEGDTNKTFRIVEGAIVGGTLKTPIPRNEFLCTTRNYTNFILTLNFKLLGEGANAGVQIRTKRIPNHHEVIGYQADMGDGWWGSLYDESRRNKILAAADPELTKKILKRNHWNEYKIKCEGKNIQLWINGQETVNYTEKEPNIDESGVIAVQIHSGPPSEAWYKDISIQELP
ncbi:MAG: 3-keto-disaccharide hydrolase [Verrucomicrobiales bacterium]